jgi:NTP pyrophosphatase (non-canonical NTP hydrolase)
MENKILAMEVYTHNTCEKNMICCIEEMSELIKVLTKKQRNSDKFSKDKLKEEVAHVLLMCNVMAFEYDISDEDILTEQKDAVNRMKEDDK